MILILILSEYRHTYFVKNPKQVCPKYVVKVQLVDKDAYIPSEISTSHFEFVDAENFKPVYVHDIKSDENKFRQLLSPEKAYIKAKNDAKSTDQLIASKSDIIMGMLAGLDDRVRAVNINYAECHEQIIQAQKDALDELERVTRSKLEGLLSVEVELRRQQEELLWLSANVEKQAAFVESKPGDSTALEFLNIWRSHIALRNKLAKAKPIESGVLLRILPDMKIQNNLRVIESSRPNQGREQQRDIVTSVSDGFSSAVGAAVESGLFLDAITSKDEVVPMRTQSLIDRYSERIQAAINEVMEEIDVPLPFSVTRPLMAGESVNAKKLLDPSYVDDSLTKVDAKKSFEAALNLTTGTYPGISKKSDERSVLSSPTNFVSQKKIPSPASVRKGPVVQEDQSRIVLQQQQQQQKPYDFQQIGIGATLNRKAPKEQLAPVADIPDAKFFSVDELKSMTTGFEQFSLVSVAEQKLQRLGPQVQFVKDGFIFPKSGIFTHDEAQVYLFRPTLICIVC